MDPITFFALAVPLVLVAGLVVLHPNPVYSALFLVLTLFLLAVYYLFLEAHMVAVLQIIVYAGAVMVLFLFVIMLLNLQTDPQPSLGRGLSRVALGGGAVLIVELAVLLGRAPTQAPTELPEGFGTVVGLSERLFTDFLIPFEVTSVLLLVAVVGAVVLAQRQT